MIHLLGGFLVVSLFLYDYSKYPFLFLFSSSWSMGPDWVEFPLTFFSIYPGSSSLSLLLMFCRFSMYKPFYHCFFLCWVMSLFVLYEHDSNGLGQIKIIRDCNKFRDHSILSTEYAFPHLIKRMEGLWLQRLLKMMMYGNRLHMNAHSSTLHVHSGWQDKNAFTGICNVVHEE